MSARRSRSIGSIFWGLILVCAGGLLLARNMGYPIPIWSGIAIYWPVLLIVWGMLKFVDYYRFKRADENRPLFSGGEVALLVLIILSGTAITTAANISPYIGAIFKIGDLDLWDITGNSYEYEEHEELEVPPGSTIEIVNLYGNVDVRPADADRVVLEVKKTVRASSKEEADRRAGEFTFSIKNDGFKYRVISNRDESALGQRQWFKSSLTIQVPRHSSLQIDNRNGRVTVQDLMGSQRIVNRFGPVEVRGIIGSLDLENRNGTVQVFGVEGNTTVSNALGSIKIESIGGDLKVAGRNNSIEIEKVQGSVNAETSFGNVAVRDAKGTIAVKNRNGDVRVTFTDPPQNDISISAQLGNITFELPSTASFRIDGQTAFGSIESEFKGAGITSTSGERSLNGQVGQGGPHLNIDTRNGDIRLEKRG